MKKLVLVAMTIATLATSALPPMNTQAATVTNKDVVNQYIEESFMREADYSTIFIKSENLTKKMLRHRKVNGIIYVEKIKSTSCGLYGCTSDGNYIKYNKWTRPGKKVNSFLVHNPESRSLDDIIAVVDHKRIR